MPFWSNWFGGAKPPATSPRASFQDAGGGIVIATSQQLEEALRAGSLTASGATVAPVMREIAINTGEIYAMPGTTQRTLDDARIDVASWLADEISIEFAEQEGAAFASGNGINRPRGTSAFAFCAIRSPPSRMYCSTPPSVSAVASSSSKRSSC